MPRDLRPTNPPPLSETEARTLQFLLDKAGQSQPAAIEQRAKERALEAKLRAKREKMAREEARRSEELATLRINIDTVSAKIHELAPSGVAWRFVDEGLQKLAKLTPAQSFFGTRSDNLDRDQIMLLAEIGLAVFENATKQKSGPSLRERMESVKVDIGPGPPEGPGNPSDGRAQLAAAIVRAGKRRRGEEQ